MFFRHFLLVVTVFLLVFPSFGLVHLGFGGTSENAIVFSGSNARSAIVAAEERIVVCYWAAGEADEAGANVTALLAVLNEAGWLLSKAKLAYKMGDFDLAGNFAVQSQERLNGFVADADVLGETAIREHYLEFFVNVAGSIIGAIGVVCVGFFVWFFLKRKYEKVGRVV